MNKKKTERQRQIRLSIKRFRKKQKRKYCYYSYNKPSDVILEQRVKAGNKEQRIFAPHILSFVRNPTETLTFFSELRIQSEKKMPIFLDFSNITQLTIDVLLYLISIFDYWGGTGFSHHVRGNLPNNPECKELFVKSGFFRYVSHPISIEEIKPDANFLQIEFDSNVVGVISGKVTEFVSKHLKKTEQQTKGIYRILTEMMLNTKQHAYLGKEKLQKWYLMAHYNQGESKIEFSFLDNGLGIPNTISKRFREVIRDWAEWFKAFESQHTRLLVSAFNGDFRTKTKQRYRGKGLPEIKKFSDQKYIDDLVVLSDKGYVDFSDGQDTILSQSFQGTLYSWSFV